MNAALGTLRIVRHAVVCGAYDYFAIYTLKSWILGWMLRVLSQITFFALIGRLLESDVQTHFLLIGNAIMVAGMGATFALNMTTAERSNGTLPLLLASPSRPVIVFSSRGIYIVADAVASALLGLFLIAPVFDLALPWPRVLLVVPLTALVGLSAYCFSTFLAGVVLRHRQINSLVVNATIVTLMTMTGVNVPIDVFPTAFEWIANALPITHGLHAIRQLVDGEAATTIAASAALEALVGLAWLTLALATFGRFVGHGRRDGSLEFAS
ncbi:MAG: ABC transporter permease [Actinomycetota bacterium]|nr:ABC transporter permease [Actinomycetota bacterium]